MKNKLLNLLLIGSIVLSVMLGGCKKAKPAKLRGPDYSKPEGEFTDTRDNKTYKWVKIGDQIWMAENLAYTGKGVRSITDKTDWKKNKKNDAWCYYVNDEDYKKAYAVLYQWKAAKKACPIGWHLPTSAEWAKMEKYLKSNGYSYDGNIKHDYIAKSLATDYGWKSSTTKGSVGNSDYPKFRNKTGFSAVPGGFRDSYGWFYNSGGNSVWWSSTDYKGDATGYLLDYDKNSVDHVLKINKLFGFSVRCIKH